VSDARNSLLDLEDLSDEELERLQKQFQRLKQKEDMLDSQNQVVQEDERRQAEDTG
jgi:hypothetical protein